MKAVRLKVVLLLCLASIASAAVDGTVTNRTSGKPQPGATVTLYKLGENGLESVESVKSDAAGKFRIDQDLKGPRLLQSAYDGVTYNHMLPPNAPSSGVALDVYNSSRAMNSARTCSIVTSSPRSRRRRHRFSTIDSSWSRSSSGVALDVYNSSKQPGGAKVMQHMVLFEPKGNELAVSESYIWLNSGKTTFNDPDGGTLRFYAPVDSKAIQVNCTAPQGMPIRRAPVAAGEPNVFKIDFPIKPGETSINLNYGLPYT